MNEMGGSKQITFFKMYGSRWLSRKYGSPEVRQSLMVRWNYSPGSEARSQTEILSSTKVLCQASRALHPQLLTSDSLNHLEGGQGYSGPKWGLH